MPADETSGRLTVGLMAGLTGLSPKALRHYDRIGLLRPASVDTDTGYRRCDPAQVAEARLVSVLRSVESRWTRYRPGSPPGAAATPLPSANCCGSSDGCWMPGPPGCVLRCTGSTT